MNISIFGLGYVGCVSVGCLAKAGHKVVGVDIDQDKVNQINSGIPTVVEKDLDSLIKTQRAEGKIQATKDVNYAINNTNVSLICVGTPSSTNGHLDFSAIKSVVADIGRVLKNKDKFHVIAIRSTIMPGICEQVSDIIEKESGKRSGLDFYVLSNPEFLREGTAVTDYFNPPYILLGAKNEKAINIMRDIYKGIDSEIIVAEIAVAELIKFVNNSFHALKVTFGNEVGNICKQLNINSHELMEIFVKDKQLNISSYYLKPGFAYGGSCLPKDLKAFKTIAYDNYIDTPVINSIEKSNDNQIERAFNFILNYEKNNIGFLGLSFKKDTDDLRNSPNVILLELLFGKGKSIKVYDKNVNLSILKGANKNYINSQVPHIKDILSENIDDVINNSDIIIIGNKDPVYIDSLINSDKIIIDLVHLDEKLLLKDNYFGINW